MSYMIIVVIGAVTGWVAGQFLKGSEHGVGIDIAAGAVGACVFVVLSRLVSAGASGFMMSTLIALIGGVLSLYVMRKILKAKSAPAPVARRR